KKAAAEKKFADQAARSAMRTESVQRNLASQVQQSNHAFAQFHRGQNKARQEIQATTVAIEETTRSLPRLRYALHDVSTALTRVGLGMTALGVATVGTSIRMERQFADVIRTTMDGMTDVSTESAALRREFTELFTTLPVSW